MRLTSLCLNPSIDRTVSCAVFDPSSANRVRFIRDDIGGKGINTAVQAANLGAESVLALLSPVENRALIRSALLSRGVDFRDVPVPGRLRVNLKIQTGNGDTVEINEEGARAGGDSLEKCFSLLESAAVRGGFCLLTGSLPPGAPEGTYRDLVPRLRRAGARVAVDADGAALSLALEARPDLIKPNRQEFIRLTGSCPDTPGECAEACRRLIGRTGVGAVCLTLGGDGALYVSETEALFAPAIKVETRSLHGAGDSMLSALCLRLSAGEDARGAFAFASAAAAATVALPGTEMADEAAVRALLGRARITSAAP